LDENAFIHDIQEKYYWKDRFRGIIWRCLKINLVSNPDTYAKTTSSPEKRAAFEEKVG
jgi:hypothetical protein